VPVDLDHDVDGQLRPMLLGYFLEMQLKALLKDWPMARLLRLCCRKCWAEAISTVGDA
jgi:hypothetical protein